MDRWIDRWITGRWGSVRQKSRKVSQWSDFNLLTMFHQTESQCHKEARGLNNCPCEECKSLIGGKPSLERLWNTLTHTWNTDGHKQLDILTEGTTAAHQILTNKSLRFPPFRQALSVNIYKPIFYQGPNWFEPICSPWVSEILIYCELMQERTHHN